MVKTRKQVLSLSALLFLTLASCAPSFVREQLNFGVWAAQRDMWDEAVFRWKKVLSRDPGNAAAHNNLAVALEKKGLWEEARKEYETALKLNPVNEKIKDNLNKLKEALAPPKNPEKEKNDKT